jgi:hypothetical protein
MSKSCKPAKDHVLRNAYVSSSKSNDGKKVSDERKEKLKTRREIESRLEQRQIERELSLEYAL